MVDQLKQLHTKSYKVIAFTGPVYRTLFFSVLLKRLKTVLQRPLKIMDMNHDPTRIISQLNMSFLGEHVTYWLGSLEQCSAQQRNKWITFLSCYDGPHTVICFIKEIKELASSKKVFTISVLETIDKNSYKKLMTWLYPSVKDKRVFFKKIFGLHTHISLEHTCLLMQYYQVLGTRSDDFINTWLDKIIAPDTSLFQLSQFFFSKKIKQFLSLWRSIRYEFPNQFWVVFWSEQLWRAHYFISFQKNKNIVDAKKIAYRLPFSLIQRDWRALKADELRAAHQRITDIDFQFKHNGSDFLLDGFYASFFNYRA